MKEVCKMICEYPSLAYVFKARYLPLKGRIDLHTKKYRHSTNLSAYLHQNKLGLVWMIPVSIMAAILKGSWVSKFIQHFSEQMAMDKLWVYILWMPSLGYVLRLGAYPSRVGFIRAQKNYCDSTNLSAYLHQNKLGLVWMIPVGIMGAILKGSRASKFICYFYEQMATDKLWLKMVAFVYAVQYKLIYKTIHLK
jgi:hypothetical protein